MKSLILIAVLLSSSPSFAVEVEYTVSKTHGLYVFVETIAENGHRSKTLRAYFENSKFNTKKNRKKLARFRELKGHLYKGYNYSGYPIARRMGIDADKAFVAQSGYAQSLKDFQSRVKNLIPIPVEKEFFELLAYFKPIYEKLIWEENFSRLTAYKEKIEKVVSKKKLNTMFDQAKTFYGATWPDDMKFRIGLYPIPAAIGHSSAESIGSFESVGVLLGDEDVASTFAVIFHELCHSLYGAQDAKMQEKFEKWFSDSSSPYATQTYMNINEGLATAIGNGWAFYAAVGELDDGSWYNFPYTDVFAKAIYQDVNVYLGKGRRIDKRFIRSVIKTFSKTLPDSIYEYDNLMNRILLLTNKKINPRDVDREIRKHFRLQSVKSGNKISNQKSINLIKSLFRTAVFVTTKETFSDIEPLTEHISLFKDNQRLLAENKESSFIFSALDKKGRPFIHINLRESSHLPEVIKKLKALGKIEQEKKIHLL